MGHHEIPYTDAEALAAAIAGGLSKVVWKDVSERALSDLNRTTSLDWTDLDLTAYTSSDAKFVIIMAFVNIDSITGAGYGNYYLRKNGTTPAYQPLSMFGYYRGDLAGGVDTKMWVIGLDSGQVIEYKISVSGTIQFDTYIDVLGYIE